MRYLAITTNDGRWEIDIDIQDVLNAQDFELIPAVPAGSWSGEGWQINPLHIVALQPIEPPEK